MYISIEVPDIPDYPNGFLKYWSKLIFNGAVSSNYQIVSLASTYVRLVEAALVEYRLGASMLRDFWAPNIVLKISSSNRSVSHFESCLSNMQRAIRCYNRLRQHKSKDALCLAINCQKPSFATDRVAKQIRDIRDVIHHFEERLMKGDIQEGQPFMLKSDGPETPHTTEPNQTIKTIDRLVLGQHELLFSSLSTWLTEMGSFAEMITEFDADRSASVV